MNAWRQRRGSLFPIAMFFIAMLALGPVTKAQAQKVTVPAGTRFLVRMIDSVDSSKNRVGDRFRASLEGNLVVNGKVVAPKGAPVYGRLAKAKAAGRMKGSSALTLELTDISINNSLHPLVTSDYQVAGKGSGGKTAKRTVGGAGLGALIGAIAGGGKGAAIGAAAGGGAGAMASVLTKGEQVRVPSETLLEFRLMQPTTLPVSK